MHTVVVVDDATVMREALAGLLVDVEVVAAFGSVEALLDARPVADLVILDLHLSNATQPDVRQGIAALRAAIDAGYRVCVYSQEERRFVLAACLAAGASGIVSKASPLDRTGASFAAVAAGEVVMPAAVIGIVELLVRRDSLTIVSERLRQVLAGRARGLTYAQMSARLYLSESTLRGYWAELMRITSEHLRHSTPAAIEQALGLAPGDLLDYWPAPEGAQPSAEAPSSWWRLRPPAAPD